jgi:hypothetical protein
MSPLRHSWVAVVASLALGSALGVTLSGCSSSGSSEPTASHTTRHRSDPPTTEPTETTSSPTVGTSPPAIPLTFSPKSGGKHLDECQRLEPGDDPAEFVYYPVVIKPGADVVLDQVTTVHTDGVVEAGSWVAPVAATPETGTFKGWPPKFVAQDPNLQWSKRVPAAGASLTAGASYNVFLRLQVDPTPGDSTVSGLEVTFHDASGSQVMQPWRAKTTFSMSC